MGLIERFRAFRAAGTHGQYVRSDGDILLNSPDGWVADQAYPYGPYGGTFGSWPGPVGAPDTSIAALAAGRPTWWLGDDDFSRSGPWGPWGPDWYESDLRTVQGGAGYIPAITRLTNVIVNAVVQTRWVYNRQGVDQPDMPLWVNDPQLLGSAPGPLQSTVPIARRMTGKAFWETILTHAVWWGRGAFVFIENADGQPIPGTLRILNPFSIRVNDNGSWSILGEFDTDFEGRFQVAGRSWRLAVVRGLPPHDGATPEGVLVRHFDTFRVGATISTWARNTFESGVPSGFLKVTQPNFSEEKAAELKKNWMDAHGGTRRSVAVLNATVDYSAIAMNPVDAALDRTYRVNLMSAAHAFGLSGRMVDEIGSSLNYANLNDSRRDLVDLSTIAWGQQLLDTLSAIAPYGTKMRVNWQTFTAPDITQQVGPLVEAVGAGLLSIEEARLLMGYTRSIDQPAPQAAVTPPPTPFADDPTTNPAGGATL